MADEPRRGEERAVEPELDDEETAELEATVLEALRAVEQSSKRAVAADPAEPTTAEPEGIDDPVSRLQAEVTAQRDRAIRTLADFDNFRKRAERESSERERFDGFEVLREFLSISDNLERALESEGGLADLKQGVELTLRQLRALLRRRGVTRLEAVDQPFDPSVHEAVRRTEDAAVDVPTVVEEMLPGYQMHERLLRPATVGVAMPVAQAGAADADENEP